jgi:heme-degrading monooxygenase HmoA
MFVILWEYEVKPDFVKRFETIYGPAGDWVQLFQTDANFRQTRLLADHSRPNSYVTIDYWESQTAYEHFRIVNRAAYEALDRATEGLTLREQHIVSATIRESEG